MTRPGHMQFCSKRWRQACSVCIWHGLSNLNRDELSVTIMQGALAYSLPLKKVESGLDTLYIWGRVLTRNGKDYIVAEGYNNAFVYKVCSQQSESLVIMWVHSQGTRAHLLAPLNTWEITRRYKEQRRWAMTKY